MQQNALVTIDKGDLGLARGCRDEAWIVSEQAFDTNPRIVDDVRPCRALL